MIRALRDCLFVLGILWGIGCDEPVGHSPIEVTDRESALALEAMWAARAPESYSIWSKVDESTAEGRRLRRLLRLSDVHYQEGLSLFKRGEMGAARLAFERGAAIAPIDPEHYFELAKIFEQRHMNESAAKYYMKYARIVPSSENATRARTLAGALDPTVAAVFDEKPAPGKGKTSSWGVMLLLVAGGFLGGAIVLGAVVLFGPIRGRGVALSTLIDQAPKLHTAIAYLIGSLRHELLKHRIGVMGDVIENMASANATGPQRRFLRERLYGGVPVDDAWRAHMAAFTQALGGRFNPRKDRRFKSAHRAIFAIASSEATLLENGPKAIRILSRSLKRLKEFDVYLAEEQARLVRTLVNTELLRQVADEVGGEYTVSTLDISEIDIQPVHTPVFIEVQRVDLLLILKNLFRNAILAVAKSPMDQRRVRMWVEIDLEPTGEESVTIIVYDGSAIPLAPEQITDTSVGSGLDLVTTAVGRYDGSLDVRSYGDGGKAVAVRFFRAFEDSELM